MIRVYPYPVYSFEGPEPLGGAEGQRGRRLGSHHHPLLGFFFRGQGGWFVVECRLSSQTDTASATPSSMILHKLHLLCLSQFAHLYNGRLQK